MPRSKRPANNLTAPPDADPNQRMTKHKRVFDHLLANIQSGQLKAGDRLPSEAELGQLFDASRITVAKAVLDLQRMGLVTRRPGAGTHVQDTQKSAGRTFGLLIPELGLTEIFEPICRGMMRAPFAKPDGLLWGNTSTSVREIAKEAEQLAHSFITQKVAGVFFAPIELTPEKDIVNRRLARSLERAGIPIVLLDRCYMPFPERSQHDLVGIDNRRAGFVATWHLLEHQSMKPAFVGQEHAAATVEARISGFFEALRQAGLRPESDPVWRGNVEDEGFVRKVMDARPDGIVCVNDLTAARLMQALQGMGARVPEDVRIVGMDDVKYASLLSVPLTTIHQDCAGIGIAAMATMLQRLDHPELPVRDVLVPTKLVVRKSCGAHLAKAANGTAQTVATSGLG